jgi:hypothetical protein
VTLDSTSTLTGDVTMSGAATVGTTLGVTGATTLSSTLGVTGASTLTGDVTMSGAATVGTTLGVTGATTLSSTLDVQQDGVSRIKVDTAGALTATSKTGQDITLHSGNGMTLTTSVSKAFDVQQNSVSRIKVETTGALTLTSGAGVSVASAAGSTLALKQGSTDILSWDTNGATTLNSASGQDLTLSTGGTAAVTVDSSGNVGIGTANPSHPLHVVMDANDIVTLESTTNPGIRFSTNSDAYRSQITQKSASGDKCMQFWVSHTSGSEIAYNWLTGPSYPSRMVLLDNGNLGIGTTSPTYKLHVNGNARVDGTLSKQSGTFTIDHPLPELKDTHYLYHSFIEGPRADLIYRGRVQLVDGVAVVNIDDVSNMTRGTFNALNRDVQCFTSNESDWDNVKGTVTGNVLRIESQNPSSNATVSWMVIGERQDEHMRSTRWTDDEGRVIPEHLKESG